MSQIESLANPLLQDHELPPFSVFTPEQVVPAVTALIEENKAVLAKVLASIATGNAPQWNNLVAPLEEAEDRLNKAFAPVSHLHGVANSEALREPYNQAIAFLTEYGTELSQNEALFDAYLSLAQSDEYGALTPAQQKTIDNALRDFRLGGVALPAAEKQRYGAIKKRLSELSTQYSNNLLDATQAWYFHTEDAAVLAGLPESALAQAAEAARAKSLEGFVITLDFPSYYAVMMHATNRDLRRDVYSAYVTRASELGKNTQGELLPALDNTPLMAEILSLRHELANLVGFGNYAERSLATKMADSPEKVFDFLNSLGEKAKPAAEADLQELRTFASELGIHDLQAWDITFVSEKLREQKYSISQETLRAYFPFEHVLSGLFTVVKKLFDIDVAPVEQFDTYHPDVRFFEISRKGEVIAKFYLDAFAREHKRGGAWMDDCRVRRHRGNTLQLPVAFLVGNFTPPIGDEPALLTHDEVTTLFHEFGHGIHHMLTKIDVAAVSGINGVAWDAVELPSQFMENWCWQPESIALISRHYKTGAALPDDLLQKMLAAKNFQSGLFILRQLEFALFDFHLHADYDVQSPLSARQVLQQIRAAVAVMTPPEFNRFENSFSHIFAGGYAAGYYSYLWAEVLSADAFSAFEEAGIFDQATGQRFLESILEQGGSQSPMVLFQQFRGREPQVDALLRHAGLMGVTA